MTESRKQEFEDIYKRLRNRIGNVNETLTWNYLGETPSCTMMRLHALVKRITYKKGSSLTIGADAPRHVSSTDYVRFTLTLTVTDIDPPYAEKPLHFANVVCISEFIGKSDEQILREWIYPFILRSEEHELREWFKYRGEHVVDPHPTHPDYDFECLRHLRRAGL